MSCQNNALQCFYNTDTSDFLSNLCRVSFIHLKNFSFHCDSFQKERVGVFAVIFAYNNNQSHKTEKNDFSCHPTFAFHRELWIGLPAFVHR